MSKILFINRSFWPDTDATGVLLTELAEDLAVEHEVTVICGPANTASSRIWPLLRRESYGAVKVVRTFGAKLSKRNLLLRFANLGIYWILASVAALRECTDVVIGETDPPLLGMLGAIVKRLKGCRFIYYCQDLYPDIAEATRGLKSRPLLAFLRWCNKFAFRRADAIVVLGADMAERLQRKGVPAVRMVVIPNWIDCRKVKPQPPSLDRGTGNPQDFVVMYAGNFGWSQNLESVLETARLMRDDHRIKFVLVGDGCRKRLLERKVSLLGLHNVEFIDHHSPSAMSEVLAKGHLHLVPLTAGAAGCLVPSKVYGILAAGKPFVAMMESDAEVARLASEFEVGFVVPPGDAGALARTISESMRDRKLLEEMGHRARVLAEQVYDRRLVTQRFAEFLEAMLSAASAARRSDATEAMPTLEIEKVATMQVK